MYHNHVCDSKRLIAVFTMFRILSGVALLTFVLFVGCQEQLQQVEVNEVGFSISSPNPKEGENILLECRVSYQCGLAFLLPTACSESRGKISTWSMELQRDGVATTKTGLISGPLVSTSESTGSALFRTQIQDISRYQSGTYRCIVTVENSSNVRIGTAIKQERTEDERLLIVSRESTLTVRYFPNITFPQCSPSLVRVHLGNQAIISCTSEDGNPPVNLIWRNQDRPINTTSHISESKTRENGLVKSTLTFTPQIVDTNNEIFCELESADFPDVKQSCSVSVQIIWAISMTVYPEELSTVEEKSVEFTCRTGNTLGTIGKYQWYTIPEINQSRLMIADNRLRITNIQLADNGSSIYCAAIFEDRWFESLPALLLVADARSQSSDEESSLLSNAQQPTPWISAFVILLIMCVVLIVVVVYMFVRNKQLNTDVSEMLQTSTADNVCSTESNEPKVSYMSLQGTHKQEEYTALNVATESDSREYANWNKSEDQFPQGRESLYEYPEADELAASTLISTADEEHIYGNVKQ